MKKQIFAVMLLMSVAAHSVETDNNYASATASSSETEASAEAGKSLCSLIKNNPRADAAVICAIAAAAGLVYLGVKRYQRRNLTSE